MGYTDIDTQREFQRQWMADRRAALLEDKSCELCGTKDNLIVIGSKKRGFWSLSPERQRMIMKSVRILCNTCWRTEPNTTCENPACAKRFRRDDSRTRYCSRECYRQDSSRVNLNRTYKEK